MKSRRHSKILELIEEYHIDTQEELLRRLRDAGFDVTQATVSRDMKELRLVKTLSRDGRYQYSTGGNENAKETASKFLPLLADSVLSVDNAMNLVVMKTPPGMAPAVCAAMDAISWDGLVGTLAGDDTLFLACKDEAAAKGVVEKMKKMIAGR